MATQDRGPFRIRQVALVAADLEWAVGELQHHLGLGEPYRDPGVATFGLANAVFAVGDTFIEIVSPQQPDTAGGRHLDRLGRPSGGYMVIVQVAEQMAVRARAEETGVRTVWSADAERMSTTHFHPSDLGGALLSADTADPPEVWDWAGPGWEERQGDGRVTRIVGATVATARPEETAGRWRALLGGDAPGLEFRAREADEPETLAGVTLECGAAATPGLVTAAGFPFEVVPGVTLTSHP